LNTPVFAQTCCPAGCSLSGYGPGCWFNGTTRSCGQAINCPPSTRPTSPTTGQGTPVDVPILQVQPRCGDPRYLTPEARAAATNQCIADLAGTATLWGCGFEDDAGRAEDVRTGLSCADRQRALANQCWRLCARFARVRLWCADLNADWQTAFGGLAGNYYGYAYIDRCGPRLPYAGTVTRPPYFHP
jgi:hypothetical protein